MPSTIGENYKIMVVGAKGVGKSAFVVKYLTGRFIWEYQSDHESKYVHKININNEEINIEILDPVNLEDERVRWADGFIIMYDVTDLKSFNQIYEIKKQLEEIRTRKNVPFVIVGTKIDLSHCRMVSPSMSLEASTNLVAAHFECSSCAPKNDRSTININDSFEALCRDLTLQRPVATPIRRRKSSFSQIRLGFKNLVRIKSHSTTAAIQLPETLELSDNSNGEENFESPRRQSLRKFEDVLILDKNANEANLKTRRKAVSSPNLRRMIKNTSYTTF